MQCEERRMLRCWHSSRALSLFLGIVFFVSSVLKAMDLTSFAASISYMGIIGEPGLVEIVAVGVIGAECVLGLGLIQGIALRRIVLPLTIIVLVGFSGMIVWAWVFRGLEDCGCFGKFLRLTPGETILKNLVLIGLAVWAWRETGTGEPGKNLERKGWNHGSGEPRHLRAVWRIGVTVLGTGAIVGVALFSSGAGLAAGEEKDKGHPFAGYALEWRDKKWLLGDGEYVVAMLSDSCSHCAQDVGALNRLAAMEEIPPVVGLVLGEEETLEQFRREYRPEFPTKIVPVLEFFELIGEAPPRVYVTRDGRAVRQWDEMIPAAGEIVAALAAPEVE